MRLWPTESMRAKIDCALAMVVVVDMADEPLGRRPGLARGLADDDVEADAEAAASARAAAPRPCAGSIFSATSRGGSPQVRYLSTVLGRDVDRRLRRAAEVERRMRLLHRREEELAALDPDVLAGDVDGLAGEQRLVGLQELARDLVALGVARGRCRRRRSRPGRRR